VISNCTATAKGLLPRFAALSPDGASLYTISNLTDAQSISVFDTDGNIGAVTAFSNTGTSSSSQMSAGSATPVPSLSIQALGLLSLLLGLFGYRRLAR